MKLLRSSYAARLRKAFSPEAADQLFRWDEQLGLFDPPFAELVPRRIRCAAQP